MPNVIPDINQISIYVGEIFFGAIFLLIGLISAGIALIRRGRDLKILVWLALWTGVYGLRLLLESEAVRLLFPTYFLPYIKFTTVSISYLILIFALLTWIELTRGIVKQYLRIMVYIGIAIAVAGIGAFIVYKNANALMLYNNLVAAATLVSFIVIIFFKSLAGKYLILPNRGILALGISVFMIEALYSNLARFLNYKTLPFFGWFGFAILIFSMAYAAAKMIFSSERKLIEIENEMETARQIQKSILPKRVPDNKNFSIAASYYPMTAVAGDYYDFIETDNNRTGFLIADVSGHGVPAALIASMIKVAMQSVTDVANNPGLVLKTLGNILSNQLNDQFVTASYLFIDPEKQIARYSAAGHPPLYYWNSKTEKIEQIKSNGLLLGVLKDSDYPVHQFSININDRFLLYTDGLIETENSEGKSFGEYRLSEFLNENKNLSVAKLNENLFKELKSWQPKDSQHQDDLTWVLIDIK